ncbi:hypothetical protein HZC31_03060, partial [Candidatus Woesearchaeota archaeon]|nr:hypothetical protein [Candidatus Woesearchaeota archaeon]
SIRTYNQPLPTDKIVDHEGWRAALEYDVPLLRNYSETVVRARELQGRGIPEEIIGFYVWQNTTDADNIGALFVNYLVISSIALGNYNLDNLGSFVRVAPSNFVEIEGKS